MTSRCAPLRIGALLLAAAPLLLGPGAVPALAQEEGEPSETVGLYGSVVLEPLDGRALRWDGRRFAGRLEVRAAPDGLVVIEHVPPERYLLGIQEVPLSWPAETLRAQAVAARTYLAWTLSGGRAAAGARYGFDICATDACQVYRGLDHLDRIGGEHWARAVSETAEEILVYEGRPAQALYSSTSGGRTRAVQDIFPGSPPLPYLQAVDSPGEESPFVTWTVELASWKLADVLRSAGYLVGPDVGEAEVLVTEDGEGPWRVRMVTGAGAELLTTGELRRALNVHGSRLFPEDLPARRSDGSRYPQAILSYTFSIERERRTPPEFRPGYPLVETVYVVEGRGWGHHVGMSQYGAKAMADAGAGYEEILAHYYGGLRPERAPTLLPDEVTVGLDWGLGEVSISPEGPVRLTVGGRELFDEAVGTWVFRARDGMVEVRAPEGFGLPPGIADVRAVSPVEQGRAVVVRAVLSTPAELRLVVFRGPGVVAVTDWTVREAGPIVLSWIAEVDGEPARPGAYAVLVEGRARGETFDAFTTFVVRASP